ncbi:MAG TPA: response regulator [Bryobacteraceae bacterium]|nr:response regulator [Bryobacteraceae bacterium]
MSAKIILVVDADAQRRAQIRYTLSPQEYKVLEAASLQEAESICSKTEIHVDLVIRVSDSQHESERPRWRRLVPIPVLTVLFESQARNITDDFWRLPFDPEQLLSNVKSVLGRARALDSVPVEDARNPERERDVEVSHAQIEAAKMRAILMVEDDLSLRSAVSKTLRRHGFPVFEAGDGISAVALFAGHVAEIQVVLLDINLPAMSGLEVFEALQQICPTVRVILTTALSRESVTRTIGTLQPWAFVQKPYRVVELVELVLRAQTGKRKQ